MTAPWRNLLQLLIAALVTSALGSVFLTQFVVFELHGMNVNVPFLTQLTMTATDLRMLQMYFPVICACLLVGFLIAVLGNRYLPGTRRFWFVLAGIVSVVAVILLMKAAFGLMIFSGARTIPGLLMQGLAGGFGGWLFERQTR